MGEKKMKPVRQKGPRPVLSIPQTAGEIGKSIGTEQPARALPAEPLPETGFGNVIENCRFIDCRQAIVAGGGAVHVIASEIDGDVIAHGVARVVLDARTSMTPRSQLRLGRHSAITFRDAKLGDRFVAETEMTMHQAAGVWSTRFASPSRSVYAATGSPPQLDDDHRQVGDAIARCLGDRHTVVPEEKGSNGKGAELRDRTFDPQVDVFLRAHSDDPADDRRLQVVRFSDLTASLARDGVAVDLVFDIRTIRAAIASKKDFAAKDRIELVLSWHLPIADSAMQVIAATVARGELDMHGYRRIWLVDAKGYATDLTWYALDTDT
jgi:hypothetical protein